jgi:hypothetical protein
VTGNVRAQRHRRVRFGKDEITPLDAFPSAVLNAAPSASPGNRSTSLARWLRRCAVAALGIVLMVAILATAITQTPFGREWLRAQAQHSLDRMVGEDFVATIGRIGIRLDPLRGIVLAVRDARLEPASPEAEDEGLRIGRLNFDLRVWPLLRGEVALRGAQLSDASLRADSFGGGERNLRSPVFDERGILNFDALNAVVFDATREAVALLGRGDTEALTMSDVDIVLGGADRPRVLRVRSARLERSRDAALSLDTELEWEGRQFLAQGTAAHADGEGAGRTSLALSVRSIDQRPAEETAAGEDERLLEGLAFTVDALREGDAAGRLDFNGRVERLAVRMGEGDAVEGSARFDAYAQAGSGKVEIENLEIASGDSLWVFNGAVGPNPPGSDNVSDYRFELVSDRSVVAPAGSREPAATVVARLGGGFTPARREVVLDEIGVRSLQGDITGNAAITLAVGGSPAIRLQLAVNDMAVSEVKQFWPWFAARGARNWVMQNVHGGRVESGAIRLDIAARRLGNGVPLGAEELSGRFALSDTSFDLPGELPLIGSSDGAVEFRGSDVDVSLDTGTVAMPGGRIVTVSDGSLTIRDPQRRPVLGRLDIAVAGEARDLLQIAAYQPIGAARFVPFAPEEIDGTVSGRVRASIPMHDGVPVEDLDWNIALDYENVDIDQPFEGQTVSDATGSIEILRDRATIDARARINGAAAIVKLIEPLGPQSDVERSRLISLTLDERGRDSLAPGLGAILGGNADIRLEEQGESARTVSADLGASSLNLPWIGWSKGSGVPARASFTMQNEAQRMLLENFSVEGESFAASGMLAFNGGQLERLRFPSARFNRNDDLSVDLVRRGRGYGISVRGASLDARSVIKTVLPRESGANPGSGGDADGVPIAIDLDVGTVTGFHGEVLSNVKLSYSGAGSRIEALSLDAVTRSGARVSFTQTREGDTRTLVIRTGDAGAVLRFLDIYERVAGGALDLQLRGPMTGALAGYADLRDFEVVNEPRLASLTSSPPPQGGRSLNEAVRGDLDVSRVRFERAFSRIRQGDGYLVLDEGVLRGPLVGATYQGTVYDGAGQMAMTGTFMPAYGLNRLFGEIPLIGQILGNGRDRGLIGITFRLSGAATEPQLEVNPLSAVAPGIFRSVFEFR